MLVIVKEIYIKLIFARSIHLDKSNHCKLKVVYIVNHKDIIIKAKKKNLKIKSKQLKKKQQ